MRRNCSVCNILENTLSIAQSNVSYVSQPVQGVGTDHFLRSNYYAEKAVNDASRALEIHRASCPYYNGTKELE